MTYLDQARASEDPLVRMDAGRYARFALDRAIAELEELAKERCHWCKRGFTVDRAPIMRGMEYGHPEANCFCDAQPEQRRLAALREEREGLTRKATEGK